MKTKLVERELLLKDDEFEERLPQLEGRRRTMTQLLLLLLRLRWKVDGTC